MVNKFFFFHLQISSSSNEDSLVLMDREKLAAVYAIKTEFNTKIKVEIDEIGDLRELILDTQRQIIEKQKIVNNLKMERSLRIKKLFE